MIKNKLSNQEIVTIALYNLGGGIGSFDIETIATEADKLAPGRFRWKTNPDMISDSNTWDALSNARAKKYVFQQKKIKDTDKQTKDTDNYLLTEEGIKFAQQNLKKAKIFDQSKIRIAVSKEIYDNTKARLQSSVAYKKLKENKINEITKREYYDFFRLNDYMKIEQKNQKIQKMKNLFISDKDFKKIIDQIANTQLNGGNYDK